MTNDEIKELALKSGFTLRDLSEDGPDLHPYVYEFASRLLVKQHEDMLAEGYRFCAKGQRTTQFCRQLEEAVKAEREACAQVCDLVCQSHNWETHAFAKAIRARSDK